MCVFINCIDNMKVGGDIICNCQYLEGKLHCKRHVIQVSKNSFLKKNWKIFSISRREPDLYLSLCLEGMYVMQLLREVLERYFEK